MAAPREKKPSNDQPPSSDETNVALRRLHIWHIQAVRDLLLLAAVVAIFWAGYALRAVTVPLLVALLLAYLFEPLVNKLSKLPRMNRFRAVASILIAGIVVVVIGLAIVVPLTVSQTSRLIDDVSEGRFRAQVAKLGKYIPESYHDQFSNVLDLLPGEAEPVPPEIELDEDGDGKPDNPVEAAQKEVENNTNKNGETEPAPDVIIADETIGKEGPPVPMRLSEMDENHLRVLIDEQIQSRANEIEEKADAAAEPNWLELAQQGLGTVGSVIGFIVQIGLLAFLIPFYFYFFSLWYPTVLTFFSQFIKDAKRERTVTLLKKMDAVVAGFVRGRIVIAFIMGVLLAIGWMICGVPYAIPAGLIVGIFCAVPYLGLVGIPLAVGLLFFDQLGLPADERMPWWGILLWPNLVFGIVQFLDGYVLTPIISGKATNLDPVTILVAVLAGGSVLGIYGMLLAIPLAACAKILVTDVLMPKVRDWKRGRAEDPLPIDRD